MSWTYTNDPGNVARDAVRFLSGDTDENNQQASDEEIAFLLTEVNNDRYLAAAGVCEAAAGRVSTKANESKKVGDLSISASYADQARNFTERAGALRAQAARRDPPKPKVYKDTNNNVFGKSHFHVDMETYK